MSVASITYPNRFKVLPSYSNSNIINRFYMYSGDLFSVNSMQLNDSKRDPSSIKAIRLDVSHDPHGYITKKVYNIVTLQRELKKLKAFFQMKT